MLDHYLQLIKVHLVNTHSSILDSFNLEQEVKEYRPIDGGWTILEILEHVALTSHFLLILIDKGASKALRNVNKLSLTRSMEDFHFDLSAIEAIGIHKSFDWIRPEHMEPSGTKSESEVIDELISQLKRCLVHLDNLKNGEGLLYETTMTVNGLGKINVYEYIYFLSKHAERHLAQIDENLLEIGDRPMV